jgi:allophanate hydrolase subunit 1
MSKLLETRKKFARELMFQQVNKELKNQVVEKKTREVVEKMGRIEEENVQQIVNSIQHQDEFIIENQKKKAQRESLVKDLEDLVVRNQAKKIQEKVGITKEEITLNKKLLSSMLDASPQKPSLPLVERK